MAQAAERWSGGHANCVCDTLCRSFHRHESVPAAVREGHVQAPEGFDDGSAVRVTLEHRARRRLEGRGSGARFPTGNLPEVLLGAAVRIPW